MEHQTLRDCYDAIEEARRNAGINAEHRVCWHCGYSNSDGLFGHYPCQNEPSNQFKEALRTGAIWDADLQVWSDYQVLTNRIYIGRDKASDLKSPEIREMWRQHVATDLQEEECAGRGSHSLWSRLMEWKNRGKYHYNVDIRRSEGYRGIGWEFTVYRVGRRDYPSIVGKETLFACGGWAKATGMYRGHDPVVRTEMIFPDGGSATDYAKRLRSRIPQNWFWPALVIATFDAGLTVGLVVLLR